MHGEEAREHRAVDIAEPCEASIGRLVPALAEGKQRAHPQSGHTVEVDSRAAEADEERAIAREDKERRMNAVLVAALEIRIGREAAADGETPARLRVALERLRGIGAVLVEDAGANVLRPRRSDGEDE